MLLLLLLFVYLLGDALRSSVSFCRNAFVVDVIIIITIVVIKLKSMTMVVDQDMRFNCFANFDLLV